MGAYSDLPNFLGENLTQIAEELKYSDANIAVLEGKIELLKSNFPQVLKNIQSCIHNRDRRTPLEYAQDLVASWIFEDYVVKKIQENPLLEILLAGADKKREILPGSRVSANSDTIICFKGRKRPLEIMTDYTGYWKNYKRIDLRDSKYEKLTNSKSLFLGFSTKDTKYILLDLYYTPESSFSSNCELYKSA